MRLLGRVAVCLPVALLVSWWLLYRAAYPAPQVQDDGYYWGVAVLFSVAATMFALGLAASPLPLRAALAFSLVGAIGAFLIGGSLFGPV